MYKTKIDLSEKVRRNVIPILNDRLADAIDLQSQVKQAHWNVKGPHFIALHELFDKISDLVLEQIDEIAERVTSLGGTAEGTVAVAAKRSKLKNYPLSITAGKDHLYYLSTQLSVFGKAVRTAIEDTDKLGDADTADLFTGNFARPRQVSLVHRSSPAGQSLMAISRRACRKKPGSMRRSSRCAACSRAGETLGGVGRAAPLVCVDAPACLHRGDQRTVHFAHAASARRL